MLINSGQSQAWCYQFDRVKHTEVNVVICTSFVISVALPCSCFGIKGKLNGISVDTVACVLVPK